MKLHLFDSTGVKVDEIDMEEKMKQPLSTIRREMYELAERIERENLVCLKAEE